MPTRLLKLFVWIGLSAMLLLVGGFVFIHLGLGIISTLFYAIATKLILLAFLLLLSFCLLALVIGISRDISAYFGKEASALRQLLFLQAQKNRISRLRVLKIKQLQYFNQFKRHKLAAADDKKQLHHLYLAIDRELQALKISIPERDYRDLYKTLRKHHKQSDAAGMLALRERIICR